MFGNEAEPVILGPNITGAFGQHELSGTKGAFYRDLLCYEKIRSSEQSSTHSILFNANRSSAIYDNSNTVQPDSLVFNYMIKY